MIRHVPQDWKLKYPQPFHYTLTPAGAKCITLDFRKFSSETDPVAIQVYSGQEAQGPLLATIGANDTLIRLMEDTLTLVYSETETQLLSHWSLIWKSAPQGNCERLQPRPQDCILPQEICGPFYQEDFLYDGAGLKQDLPTVTFTRSLEEKHTLWYTFETSDSGWLHFSIVPDGVFRDYDWALWRESEGSLCNMIKEENLQPIASNFASGGGKFGSTGMDETGQSFHEEAPGNPFSKAVRCQPDEVYYLLVNIPEKDPGKFHIRFSDNVYTCIQPQRDQFEVSLGSKMQVIRPEPGRNHFMQKTRMLRVPLGISANLFLRQCQLDPEKLVGHPQAKKILSYGLPESADPLGLTFPEMLLKGLKWGVITAYSCEKLDQRLHYGDILEAAWRLHTAVPDSQTGSLPHYWNPDREVLSHFLHAIELVETNYFETVGSASHKEVQWIRLIWVDPTGVQSNQNIALFKYEEIVPWCRALLSQPRKNGPLISLDQAFQNQLYKGRPIATSDAHAELKSFENYLWPEEE